MVKLLGVIHQQINELARISCYIAPQKTVGQLNQKKVLTNKISNCNLVAECWLMDHSLDLNQLILGHSATTSKKLLQH